MFTRIGKILEELFVNSWWVIVFMLFCYLFYEQGLKKRERDITKLNEHFQALKKEKEEALSLRYMLTMQINSQSDPGWVEMTLMKGLGLNPEGQTKVHFIKSKEE